MDKYLKDIGKTKLFPPGKESEAAFKARDGDQKAKDELIVRNLRYVIDVAKGYQGQGLPLEELIAEGNFGICKAAKRFDPEKEMKFITYAVWWIRQSILQALSENTRVVRIPINKINEIQKIRKIMEQEKHKRKITTIKLLDETNLRIEKLREKKGESYFLYDQSYSPLAQQ